MYKRIFLNKDRGAAFAVFCVEDLEKDYPECSATIADCNRMVSLEFGCHDKESQKNSIRKLQILIDGFAEMQKEIAAKTYVKKKIR